MLTANMWKLLRGFFIFFFVLQCPVMAQSDWDILEPQTPARIWRVDNNRRLIPVTFTGNTSYNETTRISVSLENIVIYDDKDLLGKNAEVAVIARYKEGDVGTNEPMLLNVVQAREKQASVIDVPLLGSRFWTGTTKYTIGLELWEIDSDKVSARLGSQDYNYGSMKGLLRNLTGSATSAVVTPQETALISVLQPILMAIVKHFEKPDPILRVRFFASTVNDPGLPAVLPLVTGRYVIQYPGGKSLSDNLLLNPDYTVAPNQNLPGGGNPPNYVVVNVSVVDQASSQDYRANLISFRDRIRSQSEILLPAALRNIVPGQTPTDLIIAQLELNDLKKRYAIRLGRENENPIKALEWFVDEVEAGRITTNAGGQPIFSDHQLRDAVSFLSNRMIVAPALNTDDPTKVFEAWRALVKSASASAGFPSRTFIKDNTDKFDVSVGADTWYYNALTQRITAARTANPSNDLNFVSQAKTELRRFLNSVEESDPRRKLTSLEQQAVLAKFRDLFASEPGDIALPSVDGSEQARARAYAEWLNNPQVSLDIATTADGQLKLRANNWVPHILRKANQKLAQLHRENVTNVNPVPALYTEVVLPVINALESNDPGLSSPEQKQALAYWLTQHSVETLGTNASLWRQYFAPFQNRLFSRDIGEDITIIRDDTFKAALATVKGVVDDLVQSYRQNPSFEMAANDLRPRLLPIKEILRRFSGQQERKLLDVFAPIAAIATEDQFNELVDARTGSTYFITFRNGQLFSTQGNYFDPADIIADLNLIATMQEPQREALLLRAIRYITWGDADNQSREEILRMLVGTQGITDFSPADETKFVYDAWRKWLFDLKPVWNPQARRYIRPSAPSTT